MSLVLYNPLNIVLPSCFTSTNYCTNSETWAIPDINRIVIVKSFLWKMFELILTDISNFRNNMQQTACQKSKISLGKDLLMWSPPDLSFPVYCRFQDLMGITGVILSPPAENTSSSLSALKVTVSGCEGGTSSPMLGTCTSHSSVHVQERPLQVY